MRQCVEWFKHRLWGGTPGVASSHRPITEMASPSGRGCKNDKDHMCSAPTQYNHSESLMRGSCHGHTDMGFFIVKEGK